MSWLAQQNRIAIKKLPVEAQKGHENPRTDLTAAHVTTDVKE